jgi:PTH1 family peptidyl-tRNA hydrolase
MFFKKSGGSPTWLVVFLGNPGARYSGTRHNAGFMTATAAEKKFGVKIDRLKFKALTGLGTVAGEKVFFMKPQTFMNLSGDAVKPAMSFYKIPLDHVLLISDDVSLPIGKLRIRRSGSAGGHNGLKDIIAKCGGDGFPRIKLGVGAKPEGWDMADWVLGAFHGQDLKDMEAAAEKAAEAIEVVISSGVDKAMNKFN